MHCTAVWHHSSNSNIKLSTTLLGVSVLSCLWIVFTNSVFQVRPQKIVRWVDILGLGWAEVIGLIRNESVPREVMPEAFKCSVRETRRHLISWTEHLNTSGITSHGTDSLCVKPITRGHSIPKISTRLTIFWGSTWKTEFMKTTHRQERTSSEKKSDKFVHFLKVDNRVFKWHFPAFKELDHIKKLF